MAPSQPSLLHCLLFIWRDSFSFTPQGPPSKRKCNLSPPSNKHAMGLEQFPFSCRLCPTQHSSDNWPVPSPYASGRELWSPGKPCLQLQRGQACQAAELAASTVLSKAFLLVFLQKHIHISRCEFMVYCERPGLCFRFLLSAATASMHRGAAQPRPAGSPGREALPSARAASPLLPRVPGTPCSGFPEEQRRAGRAERCWPCPPPPPRRRWAGGKAQAQARCPPPVAGLTRRRRRSALRSGWWRRREGGGARPWRLPGRAGRPDGQR